MIPVIPSYSDIDTACYTINLNFKFQSAIQKIDCIVGVIRGGLIPATILSHMMDVPLAAISYSSKEGMGGGKNTNILPHLNYENILFVDDICDSGKTLKEICDHYNKVSNCYTAVMYKKAGSVFVPDFYRWEIPQDFPYIEFPWE